MNERKNLAIAGLAQYSRDYSSTEELLKEADRKLYISKSEGRNKLTS